MEEVDTKKFEDYIQFLNDSSLGENYELFRKILSDFEENLITENGKRIKISKLAQSLQHSNR